MGAGNELMGWFELTLIAVLAVLVWRYQDTLSFDSATDYFFWPSLGPVLIALRYGFGRGLLNLLFMIVIDSSWDTVLGISSELSMSVLTGTALLTMLAGEFRDSWYATNQQQKLNQRFVNNRLELFTQNYHLLKVSHDQLEQRLAGKQVSLRTAVQEVGNFRSDDGGLTPALAEKTLTVMGKIITLYQAGFYECNDGRIDPKPIATRGQMNELVTDDPMIESAFAEKITVAVRDLSEEDDTVKAVHNDALNYQLVIPLVDVLGNIKGVVVADQVRFIQLVKSNIALVHLLASYIANIISSNVLTPKLLPPQRNLFLQYLANQETYYKHFFTDSSLVVFADLSATQQMNLDQIANYRRGADIYWVTADQQGRQAVVVLMPMTSLEESEKFVQRIQKLLTEQAEFEPDDLEVFGPLQVNNQKAQVEMLLQQFGAYSDSDIGTDNHSI